MDGTKQIQDALTALDPSRLSYQEWLEVGMALKAEGLPCATWDSWSMKDSVRYHPGDCMRKWNTFEGAGVAGGTIIHLAQTYGNFSTKKVYSWDDYMPAVVEGGNYYEEVLAKEAKEEEPYQMAIRYLETLFHSDETVSYVHSAKYDEKRDKWVPADAGHVRKVSAIIRDLKKYKRLDEAFGTINPKAGAWIRHNPTTGPNNKDVTRFEYVLVESDSMPLDEQKAFLVNQKLPIAALIESGGKSIHAIVKIQADDESEYTQRVNFLFDFLSRHNFQVDEANKNLARLSRMPGAERNGNIQKLVAVNIGCGSYLEWTDMINGIDDDLPPIKNFWEQLQDPPQKSPELISGILREGCKMIITGESKAGKTCLSQGLAACIAEGKPWLGKFKCEQGKVLYINLEVEEADLFDRFEAIYKANGWPFSEESCRNLHPWNLRGKAVPLDKLADKVIRRCRGENYKAIILDPLYKVQQGDENSAEAIIKFCNALDKIAHETGAAVIYDHHHPKGSAGQKKVIDRGSGSGVFARDADAMCDLSFLDPSKEVIEVIGSQLQTGEKPMQISFVLRAFKDIEPQNCFFKFPVHYLDSAGLLTGVPVEGSDEAHRQKSPKRTQTGADRAEVLETIFDMCEEHGIAKLSEMVDWCQGKPSEKTLRRYIKESSKYTVENGFVKRLEDEK